MTVGSICFVPYPQEQSRLHSFDVSLPEDCQIAFRPPSGVCRPGIPVSSSISFSSRDDFQTRVRPLRHSKLLLLCAKLEVPPARCSLFRERYDRTAKLSSTIPLRAVQAVRQNSHEGKTDIFRITGTEKSFQADRGGDLIQLDKLTIAHLGFLAQRRLARGVRLNHAEATVRSRLGLNEPPMHTPNRLHLYHQRPRSLTRKAHPFAHHDRL